MDAGAIDFGCGSKLGPTSCRETAIAAGEVVRGGECLRHRCGQAATEGAMEALGSAIDQASYVAGC